MIRLLFNLSSKYKKTKCEIWCYVGDESWSEFFGYSTCPETVSVGLSLAEFEITIVQRD